MYMFSVLIIFSPSFLIKFVNGTSVAVERDSMMGIATFRSAADLCVCVCVGDNSCENSSAETVVNYIVFVWISAFDHFFGDLLVKYKKI